MIHMNTKLAQLQEKNTPIQMGVVGAGQMGLGLISQASLMKGLRPSVIADHTIEKCLHSYELAGIQRENVVIVRTADELSRAIEQNKFAACEDFEIINKSSLVDCVVDATGSNDSGALIASGAIEQHKHIVMLNVEADVTIGHTLKRQADREGVIYTGSAGDEPGAVKELYDFADALGLDILVVGKGKNNKVQLDCNPDTVLEEATQRGIAPKMLSSFKDGTKTMVEMTCMANATGFIPDVRGAHGPKVTTENICDILTTKENGGILNHFGVIEYVDGLAPGVFIIISTHLPQIHHEIQYLKMGKGPNYLLYRPYHMCSLETPITVARAAIYHEPTIVMKSDTPVCETITIAKRDLKKGEYLDGIGGYTVYGSFETYETAQKENLVPIGIINKNTRVLRDVKKGSAVTYDDLSFDETSPVYRFRKRQEKELQQLIR